MRIVVAKLEGNAHSLEVDELDLGSTVYAKYEAASGAEKGSYFLTYGGKQLYDGDVIASVNIREGATLHAVHEPTPRLTVPKPCLFPEREKVEQQIKKWKDIARMGNFDADMHLLDPGTHHAWLEFLEKDIVENSEFFRCRGHYDLSDHSIMVDTSSSQINQEVPDFMQSLLSFEQLELFSEARQIGEDQHVLVSLRKTYFIVSRVLAGFRHLHRAGFCGSAFNVLLLQDKDIAKIVRIPEVVLARIQQGVQKVLVHISAGDRLPDGVYAWLLAHVEPPLIRFLELLGLSNNPGEERSRDSILDLCRLASIFMDLGLVSYVGSHGGRFDLEYLENDFSEITVSSDHEQAFSFCCKRSRLACLDKYLDETEVWTFSCCTHGQVPFYQQMPNSERLVILTTIEDFADIWGPVWAVTSEQGNKREIHYYQLARGVIYPTDMVRGSQYEGFVRCHWTSSSDFREIRETRLLHGETLSSLAADDLLFIGATLRENQNCQYTSNDFENSYGHEMLPLGPKGDKWNLDTLSGGLSLSKIGAISTQATAKKLPGTTLKEHNLVKWKAEPECAPIILFHQYLAVEVSHCTGNARRTQMRNLFLMAPIQILLERIYPRWRETQWGIHFLRALHSQNPDDMYKFWCDYEMNRKDVAKIIAPVLEMLSQTGRDGDMFNVGFFNSHRERYFTFQCRLNDWAKILKDTYRSATYAVISEKCLEAYTYNHSTVRCDGHEAFTVLHTYLGSKLSLSNLGFTEINQSGCYYYEDKEDSGSKTKVMSPIPHAVRHTGPPLAFIGNTFHRKNVNESEPQPRGAQVHEVFLKAGKVSSGGMASPRHRR